MTPTNISKTIETTPSHWIYQVQYIVLLEVQNSQNLNYKPLSQIIAIKRIKII